MADYFCVFMYVNLYDECVYVYVDLYDVCVFMYEFYMMSVFMYFDLYDVCLCMLIHKMSVLCMCHSFKVLLLTILCTRQ